VPGDERDEDEDVVAQQVEEPVQEEFKVVEQEVAEACGEEGERQEEPDQDGDEYDERLLVAYARRSDGQEGR